MSAHEPQRPWFRAVAVADDLSDRLALAWVVDTDVAHDLVPDAHVDVVWLPDGSVQVCGPEVEGWTFRPFDGPEAVGVRFRPGMAGADGRTVRFADASTLDVGIVIWATGYRSDYSWIDIPRVTRDGKVVHRRGVTDVHGLYFLGHTLQRMRFPEE